MPAMPTGVALMMTSKFDLGELLLLDGLRLDWRASFCAVSAVRLRMKTSAPLSRRPKTAARRCSAGAEDEDLGAAQRQAAFEREE